VQTSTIRYLWFVGMASLALAFALKYVGNAYLPDARPTPALLALSAPRHLAPSERYVVYGGLTLTEHVRIQWHVCDDQGDCSTAWSSPWHPDNEHLHWYHLGHIPMPSPGRYTVQVYVLTPQATSVNRSVGYYLWEIEVEP
jgi:hypothetical protein